MRARGAVSCGPNVADPPQGRSTNGAAANVKASLSLPIKPGWLGAQLSIPVVRPGIQAGESRLSSMRRISAFSRSSAAEGSLAESASSRWISI